MRDCGAAAAPPGRQLPPPSVGLLLLTGDGRCGADSRSAELLFESLESKRERWAVTAVTSAV